MDNNIAGGSQLWIAIWTGMELHQEALAIQDILHKRQNPTHTNFQELS
jgi:hypothetical protein